MYDELVKRLREPCQYENCILCQQAADAIKELQGRAKVLEKVADKWCDAVPKWIPVTERLPEKDGTFITAYSKGGVSQNWYMTFHHGGGKWYQNSEDTGEVTHWMPLPELPKEET